MDDETKSPLTRIATRPIYQNPWIEVVEDRVVKPNGSEGIYGRVLYRKLSVGIIPISRGGDTWLVGQYRYPIERFSWEIPMGGGPRDAPLETARRELREETGLTADRMDELMRVYPSASITDELAVLFLARDLTEGETDYDDTEELTLRRLPLTDVFAMVMAGEIIDAISMTGLLYLKQREDLWRT